MDPTKSEDAIARPALTASTDPERWVEEHGDCLYRYAFLRVRRPEVAEDLVQETFSAEIAAIIRSRELSCEDVIREKLALFSLIQDYHRAQEFAAGLVDLANSSPDLSKFVYSKGANEAPYLAGLVEVVKKFTGQEPKLVDVSTGLDPRTYEVWFSKH
jgi:hypothetical protein